MGAVRACARFFGFTAVFVVGLTPMRAGQWAPHAAGCKRFSAMAAEGIIERFSKKWARRRRRVRPEARCSTGRHRPRSSSAK
jgi:hypothetical protein